MRMRARTRAAASTAPAHAHAPWPCRTGRGASPLAVAAGCSSAAAAAAASFFLMPAPPPPFLASAGAAARPASLYWPSYTLPSLKKKRPLSSWMRMETGRHQGSGARGPPRKAVACLRMQHARQALPAIAPASCWAVLQASRCFGPTSRSRTGQRKMLVGFRAAIDTNRSAVRKSKHLQAHMSTAPSQRLLLCQTLLRLSCIRRRRGAARAARAEAPARGV